MEFDAVVLAGGRSSRLGGTAKAMLEIDGLTLLDITLDAVRDARHTVVVGDVVAPPGILVTREAPVFGGPAAGIAAGLAALDSTVDHVLVLACDMPRVSEVVTALLASGEGIAVDGAREDPIPGVSGQLVVDGFTDKSKVIHKPDWDDAVAEVVRVARDGDIVMTLSCGSVYKIIPQLLEALENSAESGAELTSADQA